MNLTRWANGCGLIASLPKWMCETYHDFWNARNHGANSERISRKPDSCWAEAPSRNAEIDMSDEFLDRSSLRLCETWRADSAEPMTSEKTLE